MAKPTIAAVSTLVPLPPHPDNLPWPTGAWSGGELPAGVEVDDLLDRAFDDEGPLARTFAYLVVHRGRVVIERYGPTADDETPLISWSMAKSILHAAVGILVGQGRLDLEAPAPVPEWADPDDPRHAITLEHLLTMRDGLDFRENYVDENQSDVIPMLFGAGQEDVAGFAADRPLAHEPGSHFNYSSGTTNIVSRIVASVVGRGDDYGRWLREELFEPIGMSSAEPRFDAAGTFIASSFVYATARDFARFGYLYLRDGMWDGKRILPEGWVDHGRDIRSQNAEDGRYYGAQWWVVGDDVGTFWANGYEGQSISVVPGLDLVIVRLGKTPSERYPALFAFRAEMIDRFRGA